MNTLDQKIASPEKDEPFQNFVRHLKQKVKTGQTPYCGFNADFVSYNEKYPAQINKIINQH